MASSDEGGVSVGVASMLDQSIQSNFSKKLDIFCSLLSQTNKLFLALMGTHMMKGNGKYGQMVRNVSY